MKTYIHLSPSLDRSVETLHATSLPLANRDISIVETLHATSLPLANRDISIAETLHATSLPLANRDISIAETLHATSLPLRIAITLVLLFTATLHAQTITNLTVAQRTDGSGIVDIHYTLTGAAATYYISMEASFNNGSTFSPVAANFLSGHIGAVAPGSGRHIVWNGKGSNNNTYSTQTKVKLNLATSAPCGQPFTDTRDGKTYNTVQIGTQCWMAQNLNIGIKINSSGDQTNNSIIEKYCYSNLESNCDIYGGLYQWNEMMQYVTTAGVQGICPAGWHIPTDAEWTTVTIFLGGTSVAGGKMKTTGTLQAGTGLWNSPNTAATNESGFSAVPAGGRNPYGTFVDLGNYGNWWISAETNSSNAWYRRMKYGDGKVNSYNSYKSTGFSGRCLRD